MDRATYRVRSVLACCLTSSSLRSTLHEVSTKHKDPKEVVVVSVKMQPEQREALKLRADSQERTVSQHLRWLVERDAEEAEAA